MMTRTVDAWKDWYAALKNFDPEAYRRAIQYGEGVSMQNHLSNKVAADVEVALVMLACELLGCKP